MQEILDWKLRDCIQQTQSAWKVAKLSTKSIVKGLHKGFKAVVNELQNSLTNLRKYGSEVSHFITEPRNVSEYTRLTADIKNAWMKSTLKDTKNLIHNQTCLMDESEDIYPVPPCMDVYKTKHQSDESIDKIKLGIISLSLVPVTVTR